MVSNLRAAIRGDLKAVMESRKLAYLKGLKAGTEQSVEIGKNEIRQDIQNAGFSRRLATTVRGDSFPTGNRLSYSPSGLIYSKSPKIIAGFADGGIRRGEDGGSLIIPIDGGPADGIRRRPGETTIEAFERQFGRNTLRLVPRSGKSAILVARFKTNKLRLNGSFSVRSSVERNRGDLPRNEDVPVFTVVRQYRAEKRLNTRRLLERAKRRHPARLAFHLGEFLRASERETRIR